MYELVRQPGGVNDRQFEIRFFDPLGGSLRVHIRMTSADPHRLHETFAMPAAPFLDPMR